MSRQCRSIKRAMRRGHIVDFWTGTYRSRRETTIARQTLKALYKKELAKNEDNGADSE